MPKNIGFSISGKNNISFISLKGNIYDNNNNNMSQHIKNIKISIMSLIIIPYMSQQWNKLEENKCFVEILMNKINFYLSIYKDNEYLLLYKELLSAFDTIVTQHTEIVNLEKNLFHNDIHNISSFVFKTNVIRLKPEYEIYNLIIGKPESGEMYNSTILNQILKLLEIDNITFDNIKSFIINNYKINKPL